MSPVNIAATGPLKSASFDYPLNTDSGYLIAEVEGRKLLIDTGSMVTFTESNFDFVGQSLPVMENFLGFTLEGVRQGVGVPIDALIGMNILRQFDLCIDLPASRIQLSRLPVPLRDGALPITFNNRRPELSMNFSRKPQARMLFDTGAPLSFLRRDLMVGFESVGTVEDFHPTIGPFTTQVFRVPFTLGNKTFIAEFGSLPAQLENALLAEGVDGLIGSQLIVNQPAVLAARRSLFDIGSVGALGPRLG